MNGQPPNTRVQRTRSSASPPHSPLTRSPLGNASWHRGYPPIARSVLLAVFVAPPMLGAEKDDSCKGAVLGAAFGANMLQMSQANSALGLLNGREDPKLKRVLEYELLAAIASARRDIEGGAVMPPASIPSVAPNLQNAIEKARGYVTRQGLDDNSPAGVEGLEKRPLENLQVIELWLAGLPKAASGQ